MAVLNDHPIAIAITALLVVYLSRAAYRLYSWRRICHKQPGPPHSMFFGHLISMGKVVSKLPNHVHPHVFANYLREEYDLPPVFVLDLRPVSEPLLFVMDPDIAQEMTGNHGLNKHPQLGIAMAPLVGPKNLLSSDGAFWRKWRAVFNPAFSIQQLMSQVPVIVDCAEKFADLLDKHATSGKVFRLEEEATRTTLDIIGRTICDHDFGTLTQPDNDFVRYMRSSLLWTETTNSLNPFQRFNPARPLLQKYYKRKMDQYMGKVLDERFSGRGANAQGGKRSRTGIDLALEEYLKESGKDVDMKTVTMDAEFRRYAIDNLLTLLFAGHDTTASTISYCYYHLGKDPERLERLRQELDDVFGTDVDAAEQLRNDPYLINKCEYTLAVIKEILRIWPPASTIRQSPPGHSVKDPTTGNVIPTNGCIIWPAAMVFHRNKQYWGEDVHHFRPERFLPENIDKINPDTFRPFERGPRNCIGQELALIELKIILALTVREFDVKGAYEDLGELSGDGSLWDQKDKSYKTGPQEVFGDRAYQVLLAAGKPNEGMPARVSRHTRK